MPPPFKGEDRSIVEEINVQRVTYAQGFQAACAHENAGGVEIHGVKPGRVRTGAEIGIGTTTTKDGCLVSIGHFKPRHGETRGHSGQISRK